MRKRLFLALAALLVAIPIGTMAVTTRSGNTILQGSDATIDDIYLAGGGTVDISGTFGSDVIVGGGTVTISGKVTGDVLSAGGTVKVTGTVDGNVRIAGGTVELDGVVGRNVVLLGGTAIMGANTDIKGEVIIVGGTLTQAGHLASDLNVWGGSVVLNGSVDGDVSVRTADDCAENACVVIGPNAKLGGNLEYWAAIAADVQPGATVAGTTTHHPVDIQIDRTEIEQFFTGVRWWMLFSAMVVGIVISLFLPKSLRQTADLMVRRPGPAIGFGILFLFGLPIGLLILMATVVGIPLALIIVALYLIAIYVSQVYLGYFFGNVILRSLRKTEVAETRSMTFLATVVGMLLVALVFDFLLGMQIDAGPSPLSWLGGLVRFAMTVWAFGALLMYKWGYVKEQMN
jgi:hypothetical protein